MTDLLAEQWYALCDEYEQAREHYLSVHKGLAGDFAKPEAQPLMASLNRDKLNAERQAWEHWHSVRERMQEFIADHS